MEYHFQEADHLWKDIYFFSHADLPAVGVTDDIKSRYRFASVGSKFDIDRSRMCLNNITNLVMIICHLQIMIKTKWSHISGSEAYVLFSTCLGNTIMFNCFWHLPFSRFSPPLSLLASTWPPPRASSSPFAPLSPPPHPLNFIAPVRTVANMLLCLPLQKLQMIVLFNLSYRTRVCVWVMWYLQALQSWAAASVVVSGSCALMLLGVSSGAADPRTAFRPRCRCGRDLCRRVSRKISESTF